MFRLPSLPGLRFLVVLAIIGLVLVYLPVAILRQYEAAQQLGPVWGMAYLVAIGLGTCLLLGLSGWIVWYVWRSTTRKRKRKAEQARNPSQMSLSEREREVADNLAEVSELRNDPAVSAQLRSELTPLVRAIEEKQERQTLEIVAFGTISSGKSSLLNALAGREVFATDLRGRNDLAAERNPLAGS